MSKHHVRKDPTCQNCGHEVAQRYCSYCGQENIETRQSFGHLARHFAEDVTHYDNSFWRTFKYLMTRPAYLTKAYLAGKRSSFLPPVRLYIFVSFIAFFIPYILPELSGEFKHPDPMVQRELPDENMYGIGLSNGTNFYARSHFKSIAQLDSMEQSLPPAQRMGAFDYWTEKKTIELSKYKPEELMEKFNESFLHNSPKGLFVYMPVFALVIGIFHSRKKWYYFDHAIFTLHYFSFLLLAFLLLHAVNTLTPLNRIFDYEASATLFYGITTLLSFLWFLVYFARGHYKMYGGRWGISLVKSLLIFSINLVLFIALLLGLGFLTVLTMH